MLNPLIELEYDIFGAGTCECIPWIITETEREVENKATMNRRGNKLLTNMRNIGGTERITEHMSRGQWASMVSTIGE